MRTFIAALVMVAVAGCGSSSKSTTSSSAPAPAATSTPAASTPSSGAQAITIKNFAFNPVTTTVKVGQKVTWTNQDSTAHNVTGGPMTSPTLDQGKSYSFTPKKAGTISYVCTIHPNMKATLKVVA
jgi:plastocyanin